MVDSIKPTTTLKNKYASIDKYHLVKSLGSGYNSKVKLGYDSTADKYHAVKIIKHSHPSLNLKNFKKEIEILSNLKHPNIVDLINFYDSADYIKKNGGTYKVVALVMELAPGGELFEYIADSGPFSERVARTYFKILIETLEYCHNEGFAHRDLKPENLLFDASFNLKIADFGFATLLAGKDGTGDLTTILGTESYKAPEIHMRRPYSGAAVDLFACGIILFIMLSGTPPFRKADPESDPHYKTFIGGKQDNFWKAHEQGKPKKPGQKTFYTNEFKNLMGKMLALDPSARLTIEKVKEHPWLQGEVCDLTALKAEFLQRKKLVDAELQRQREAKELVAQTQLRQSTFTRVRRLISLQEKEGIVFEEKLFGMVNFNTKREIQAYQPESGLKAHTEVFTVLFDTDFIFKLLCASSINMLVDFSVAEDTYKIKGKAATNEGWCNLNVVLTKVDDDTTCTEFQRKSGLALAFYNVVGSFKKILEDTVTQGEHLYQEDFPDDFY